MSASGGPSRMVTPPESELDAGLRRVRAQLGERDPGAADRLCEVLERRFPESLNVRLLRARARQQLGDFDGMLALARRSEHLAPARPDVQLLLAEALVHAGETAQARTRLRRLEAAAGRDPRLLQHVAELHTHLNDHRAAHRCHQAAVELTPDDPRALYNLSASAIAVGDLTEAENCLDRVIALAPDDFDAWHNRSTLRRQTPAGNHVAELEAALATPPGAARGAVALNYALAREHEDLGNYPAAWRHLTAGAAARRQRMAYDVAGDERTMKAIEEAFDAEWLARGECEGRADATPGDGAAPVFIVGLPRSGTTLVDRILSSHSRVASLGEINDFALALMRQTGPGLDRLGRVRQAARLDVTALGRAYRESTRGYGSKAPLLIDKTPSNFLYLGLIHRALPEAVVVHVHRHPMDACLGMFKSLFRMGYPFSYDLEDLARYYLGYHRLMAHWRRVLPEGRFLDLGYEALVADPEGQIRRLLAHAGLAWEPGCLRFHENRAPTATASAVQVREPMYSRAVGRWRHYAEGLAPLRARLERGGIRVED